jgi:4-amino-4-deoxy-L-arabinose transferase-like glycosyltransferase
VLTNSIMAIERDRLRAARIEATLGWLLLAGIILAPRCYLWGSVPAGIHGDEGGFATVGMQMFAAPESLSSFGPQSLPNAHFWLYGAGIELFGVSIWSARFVTSLFGALQAFAVADIARRTAGTSAALTAALVMAVPLQLHFDRLAMCNVMTTATWVAALWVVVAFPYRTAAAAAAGMTLALGWYGYQASRIAPLVAAAGLLPLLARPALRRPTIRAAAAGLIGFALVIAPLALGFLREPAAFLGRAQSTSWLQQRGDPWSALADHLRATAWAALGLQFDASGGFFPFEVPVVPIGLLGLALIGLAACRSGAMRACLAVWIVLVLAGNVLRSYSVYAPVLVCLVPALALAAAYAVRWLRWAAPFVAAVMILPPVSSYFELARRIPASEVLPMAQAALLRDLPSAEPVLIAGGVGCRHGLTAFALRGRRCFEPETARSSTAAAQLVIVFPRFVSLAPSLASDPALVEYHRQWGTTPVRIWSSIPPPAEP